MLGFSTVRSQRTKFFARNRIGASVDQWNIAKVLTGMSTVCTRTPVARKRGVFV